jgi:hypothetical protein
MLNKLLNLLVILLGTYQQTPLADGTCIFAKHELCGHALRLMIVALEGEECPAAV